MPITKHSSTRRHSAPARLNTSRINPINAYNNNISLGSPSPSSPSPPSPPSITNRIHGRSLKKPKGKRKRGKGDIVAISPTDNNAPDNNSDNLRIRINNLLNINSKLLTESTNILLKQESLDNKQIDRLQNILNSIKSNEKQINNFINNKNNK